MQSVYADCKNCSEVILKRQQRNSIIVVFCEAIAVTDRVDLLGFIAQFELL